MAIDESRLTKGQVRKLNALRKSIGDKLGDEAFEKWLQQQELGGPTEAIDPVAEEIRKALEPLVIEKNLSFGRYGYAVKRAKGRSGKILLIEKIEAA